MSTTLLRRQPPQAAPKKDHRILHGVLWLTLFACGGFSFMFKGRASSGLEYLPFSPLQVLIPLLGCAALLFMFLAFGARFPKIFDRTRASAMLLLGISFICLGAVLHLDGGEYDKECVLFVARWLMPVFFIAFFTFAQMHGITWRPIAYGFAAGALCSALAVELYRRGFPLPIDQKTEGRFGGLFSHPNQYGIVVAVSAAMIAVLLHSPRKFYKLLGLAMLPTYGLCLFQSLSKTNIVLFILCLLACFAVLALGSPGKLIKTALAMLFLSLLLAGGAVLAYDFISQNMPREAKIIEGALSDPRDVKSLDVREDVWAQAWEYSVQNPWMGLGPGRPNEVLIKNHAHNLFLQAHLDTGVPGLIGICLVVFALFWRAIQLAVQAMRAGSEMDDDEAVRVTSGVALVIYVLGNLMSDSFGTATIPIFVIFAAFAFVNEDWKLQDDED